jgi:uncharacterized protein (DUF433 family)
MGGRRQRAAWARPRQRRSRAGAAPTEHRHVVRVPGVEGGRPHVRGTGLSVELLAGFYRLGATPDELLLASPQLSAAGLYEVPLPLSGPMEATRVYLGSRAAEGGRRQRSMA